MVFEPGIFFFFTFFFFFPENGRFVLELTDVIDSSSYAPILRFFEPDDF